jgi:hypothetical protein
MRCGWVLALLGLPLMLLGGSLHVEVSNSSMCRFVYVPGKAIQYPDTLRSGALVRGWTDVDEIVADGLRLPVRHVYIVLPPKAEPVLELGDLLTHWEGGELAAADPAWPKMEERTLPTSFAKLVGVSRWRDFRLAHIEIYPARESGGGVSLLNRIQCTIRFTGGLIVARPVRDERVLSQLALNGNIGATWWEAPLPSPESSISTWPEGSLYKISVRETGLYRVTGEWLQSHGFNFIGQSSAKLHLLGNGGHLLPRDFNRARDTLLIEDAIWVEDGGDGAFDAEDYFIFYGQGLKGYDYIDGNSYQFNDLAHQSPYSLDNVYFVRYDANGADGLRMLSLPSTSAGGTPVTSTRGHVVRDDDVFIFHTADFSESGLIWYMATIVPGDVRSFVTTLPGVTDGSGKIRLDFKIRDSGNPKLTISMNDSVLLENYYSEFAFDIPLSAGILVPGSNTLTIENNGNQSTLLNFIEYEYARDLSSSGGEVFFEAPSGVTGQYRYELPDLTDAYIADIADPLHPRMSRTRVLVDSSRAESPRKYFACSPERLRTPQWVGRDTHETEDYDILRRSGRQTDMIVISPDEWFDMLAPLKDFHESDSEEPLSITRVKLSDIYDEFGWGNADPVAIRDFLYYAFVNWRGPDGTREAPRYLFLIGDGNYDYRSILATSDRNRMPAWENEGECTDDFYSQFGSSSPNLFTGRLPVQTPSELQVTLDKIIQYGGNPLYGPWKNTATFVADDEYKNGCRSGERDHTEDSEEILNAVLPPYFTFKKIYEILYPFRTSPTGGYKPDATRDLIESVNRGSLIINYMGHGNPEVWSDEQVFVSNRDSPLIQNGRMLGFFVAATCSWGQFDTPLLRCHPEVLMTKYDAGAIGSLAATRFTTPSSNRILLVMFYDLLFQQRWPRTSLGEALFLSKANSSSQRLYHLFGDPALRLATPERSADVAHLSSDSLQALSLFTIEGNVLRDSANVWEDFSGVVEARVYDHEETARYYWCNDPTAPFDYKLPGNAMFRGMASVQNGHFTVTFRVPKDVTFGGANAKISLYYYGKDASGDSSDGIGVRENIPIASTVGSESDSLPPQITAWLETPSFQVGDPVSSTPLLHVTISDSFGVNLSGEVGHKIIARVDESVSEDLTPFFNYDLDSYVRGSLEKRLGPFAQGEHRLVVEAWDSFNNLNQQSLTLFVGEEGAAGFELRDVLNWPNPMKDITYFTYFLTQPAANVTIKVYTLTGKHIYTLDDLDASYGFRSNNTRPWDGRDVTGHELANGTYLYRVIAKTAAGVRSEKTGKLVILR